MADQSSIEWNTDDCPFCGSETYIYALETMPNVWVANAKCCHTDCGVSGPDFVSQDKIQACQKAEAHWNKRTPDTEGNAA